MSATFRSARALLATPDQVLAAFADPTRLARWWGPDGFTNTFDVFEFEVDGRWIFTMHGPDGAHYANECRFDEVGPTRVVVRHLSAPQFTLTVALTAVGQGTEVEWVQVFDDADIAAKIRHIVEPANEQNLDRLTAVLAAG